MLRWKVPVVIVTGYLGSGKTTLLQKIVGKSDKKVAVIVNDLGKLSSDAGALFKGKSVDIIHLIGGCVCCSLKEELKAGIDDFVDKVRPDIIVVETAGVANPEMVVRAVKETGKTVVRSVITIVDAHSIDTKFMGSPAESQIHSADIVIVNKSDLASAEKVSEVERKIRSMNRDAKIIKTTYSNMDLDSLFLVGPERGDKVPYPAEEKDHDARSFIYRSHRMHSRYMLIDLMKRMPVQIHRAKGYVLLPEGVYMLDFVRGRYQLVGAPEGKTTELAFMGDNLTKAEAFILERLKTCQL